MQLQRVINVRCTATKFLQNMESNHLCTDLQPWVLKLGILCSAGISNENDLIVVN